MTRSRYKIIACLGAAVKKTSNSSKIWLRQGRKKNRRKINLSLKAVDSLISTHHRLDRMQWWCKRARWKQIGQHISEQQWQVSKSAETFWSHLRFANFYAKLRRGNGSHLAICSQNRAWANWLRFGNASADSHAVSDGARFASLHASLAANEAATCARRCVSERQKDFGDGRRRDRPPQQLENS